MESTLGEYLLELALSGCTITFSKGEIEHTVLVKVVYEQHFVEKLMDMSYIDKSYLTADNMIKLNLEELIREINYAY